MEQLEQGIDTTRTAPPADAPRERTSVRDSLRQSFADARQQEETTEREARTREEETTVEEPVEETTETTEAEPAEETTEAEASEEETTEAKPVPKVVAPTAWPKAAKEAFPHLPDPVKQAVIKREADVQKGIDQLKEKYTELDQVLTPYDPMIKQFGKTRGQAVAQMFSWFDALSRNPDQSFPALMQSYGYDPKRLLQAYGISPQVLQQLQQHAQQQRQQQNGQVQNGQVQQPNGQAQPQQQDIPPQDIPPQVKQYISQLEQKLNGFQQQVGQQFTGLQQHFAEQSAAKTQEMLNQWSIDKPHFEKVREKMGFLLTPDPNTGRAAIPLRDGRVDLDEAYNQAVWMDPEIRQQMWADQQAAEAATRKAKQEAATKAQQDKAAAARKASGSLTTGSPGAEVSRKQTAGKGMSVRDSLKQAVAELSDR